MARTSLRTMGKSRTENWLRMLWSESQYLEINSMKIISSQQQHSNLNFKIIFLKGSFMRNGGRWWKTAALAALMGSLGCSAPWVQNRQMSEMFSSLCSEWLKKRDCIKITKIQYIGYIHDTVRCFHIQAHWCSEECILNQTQAAAFVNEQVSFHFV